MDVQINNLGLSDFKLGAFLCILVGYIFLILPENLYTDLKQRLFPRSHEEIETHSLTRRYKYQTTNTNTSPVLNALKTIPSKSSMLNNSTTTAKIV